MGGVAGAFVLGGVQFLGTRGDGEAANSVGIMTIVGAVAGFIGGAWLSVRLERRFPRR